MTGWNLPPGCTDRDIDRAMGGDERDDNHCPECGTDFTAPHLGPELALLVAIAEYFDNHYDGAEDSSQMVLAMGKFIGPLNSLINRIKAEERVR